MERSEFENYETSCLCEVCSKCQMKKLSYFITQRDWYGEEEWIYYRKYYDYIKQQDMRPKECFLFDKYQLFDMNASIPWGMKHHIRNCFNKWRNYKNEDEDEDDCNTLGCFKAFKETRPVCLFEFRYKYIWGVITEPNHDTRTILFLNELSGLYYAVLLTKKYTFTLKTLAGLKVNEHLNQKCQLDYLVEKHFLPKQLADFLLNLHKM